MTHRVVLVTGPARSGKSEWAETLAQKTGKPLVYVATARRDPSDSEWSDRIERHRERRGGEWTTLEVPIELAASLQQATPGSCWLVDSLGTWVTNCLDLDEASWSEVRRRLLASLADLPEIELIFVAEEVGWGVIPAYPVGRLFRDRLGSLVRDLGAIADPVYLVVAGRAVNLARLGTPLGPTPDRPDFNF
ncbi:bifunctional adenosylcobinamide kinase/adenosylcobinamide-phosphate guanylyltransferase [Oxynema sp. CENA135]|uniref:bifunctional adenosylcobinamide kinase/adenosylcobinamide-phosphate guanylyltransferase n=1 Tax=Oxynema sp. CENA135 TaxID=984206 RepID=UPI00190C71E8|nr:bifunctional adenosylcobinamide kinase/adenosylcobinamide-phosphate guanylyltransferase [Oxynema sp. CENA135]